MYSTCLFCHDHLGANEVVQHFPLGRRLAFDAEKGRLWVVCRKCERWNLTPLEERWEAIEECERLFAGTRQRVSTDNIGMAKLREGLELVRIGGALRPEMAAWRYGDQFGRRRVRHVAYSAAGVAIAGGIIVTGPLTGLVASGGWGVWQAIRWGYDTFQRTRPRLRLALPGEGRTVVLRKRHLEHTAMVRHDQGWLLDLSYDPGAGCKDRYSMIEIRGADALRVAGLVLPRINATGASRQRVQSAVDILEQHRSPEELFVTNARGAHLVKRRGSPVKGTVIAKLPLETRLALEMAAHEQQERRAMEGELAILAAAWREAEEVAKIADSLLLPEDTEDRLQRLRSG